MTPSALIKASLRRQSVTGYGVPGNGIRPAAFMVGLPFRVVMNALPMMKLYKPKKKICPKKTTNS
jgi:hypothetical protein